MQEKLLKNILNFTLIATLICPQAFAAAAAVNQQQQRNITLQNFPYHEVMAGDPVFDQFVKAKWSPPEMGTYSSKDPVLDQNPFFLAGQKWVRTSRNSGQGTMVRQTYAGVNIQAENASRELQIEAPLKPLFETDEFLFFQASSQKVFLDKSQDENSYGEGLFFIDKSVFLPENFRPTDPRPVPVFFLPLVGEGWAGTVVSTGLSDLEILALQNAEGESESFEIEDIRLLARVQKMNLQLASVQAFKTDIPKIQASFRNQSLPVAALPRGITASFGLFYTGVNLDQPNSSIQKVAWEKTWLDHLIPRAYGSDLLSPDVVTRLLIVGQVTGSVLVASVLAKYTILKERVLEVRKFREAKEDEQLAAKQMPPADRSTLTYKTRRELNEVVGTFGQVLTKIVGEEELTEPQQKLLVDRSNKVYKVKRELKELVSAFGHGLSTIASGVATGMGHILEYGVDRLWAPEARVNRMGRWVLERTFLYNRNQNENIVVTLGTVLMGVVVLGGIDTVGVVLQLLYVSPIFFPWVAGFMGPERLAQVAQEFSGANADTNNAVTSEIMRNIAAYFVSGAYGYSSQQRQKIIEDVKPKIEASLMQQGINPYDPQNEKVLNNRMEAVIERMLVERGLPTNAEFLFGAPSMFRGIAHMMGYNVNRKGLVPGNEDAAEATVPAKAGAIKSALQKAAELSWVQKTKDFVTIKFDKMPVQTDDTFVLEDSRWGLISHALKRSIKAMQDLHASTPDPDAQVAVELLQELQRKYFYSKQSLLRPLSPKQNLKDAYEARKFITLMSYEGPLLGEIVKYTDLWPSAKKNPRAAQMAGKMLRDGLFSLLLNKPFILQPDAAALEKHLVKADREAARRLPLEMDPAQATETDKQILTLEIVKENIEAEQELKEIAEWKPPKQSFLEKRQAEKSDDYALAEVKKAQMSWSQDELDSPDAVKRSVGVYFEAYRHKMSELVGLHTYPQSQSNLVQLAKDAAATEVEASLEQNLGLRQHYEQLTPSGKIKFSGHMYAKAFLGKYIEMTVSNSSLVSLISPEQPGRFQKLRQTKLLSADTRLGRSLTKVVRFFESPMDNAAFQPGIGSWAKRNIPFWGDLAATGNIKAKTLLVAMTAGWISNYYLWQVHIPWSMYWFFFLSGGVTSVVSYWLDRIMINMGIRPMDTVWGKVKYSVQYTWLTYPTYIPYFFFRQDWANFTTWLGTTAHSAVTYCSRLLGGG